MISEASPDFLWIALVICALFLGFKILRYGMRPKNFPPGPPTLPVLGNLHQMPLKDFHLRFKEWADEYGPIVGLKAGGTNLILINDPDVVKALIEKRSGIYSARPDLFIREFNNNLNIAFRDNDDTWRRQRKMYHLRLNVKVANQYVPYQECYHHPREIAHHTNIIAKTFDSTQLLNDLLDNPQNFSRHLQRYTTSVASTVLYGWRTAEGGRGYVKDLMNWMDKTSEAANLQLIDFYPFLRSIYRFLPESLVPFKRKLREIKVIENRLFFDLLENAKEMIKNGKVYPSFIRDMLLSDDVDRLNEVEIANNAAHGFGAATDTQWNTSLGFIKAMILYPETQAEAHREIDRVIGSGRLPQWEDRPNLPYVRAIIEESPRWIPTTLSAAVPHSNSRDDEYNGYFIPKGSSLMMNVWTLNNTNRTNPRIFDPSRHSAEATALESNGINPNSSARPHFTFGAGRGVCPGFHVAERGLFMAISKMLWAFKFERIPGSEKIVQDAVTPGFIVRPVDYKCAITPRDEKRVEIIRREWQQAQESLDADENFTEQFFQRAFVNNKKD
ncbi:putative cytochrome P450 [Zopfia rhizophila CBS 207.26]|uniref:Putative cytochrome P450 n=1 Tax=Zopfia rhizophila CBS 207.26 TaxID=1314779 RepID=A0A6A6E6U0_9PEZI|nr:putative cytochrome P450 [Zopfia rhizophila CBS 207.26]